VSDAAIRTEKLTKFYGKHRGIQNLDLEVMQGDVFGFIGPNGAGKTTTIRMISTLLKLLNLIFPTSGRAEMLGMDVVHRTKQIKRHIGYVPAEVKFYPGMSVEELLKYSARFYGLANTGRAPELSERLGLDTRRKIDDLSTGNAKKVSLVQSMLHSPRLLILDEPTNGLDPLVQNELLDLLREENNRGVTVFFSSHVLSEVERFCKRVAIVKDGAVVANEDVAALRRRSLRKVSFTSEKAVGPDRFPSGNAANLRTEGAVTHILYAGDSNTLVRELSRLDIHQLSIEEPTLEEVFMHYYRTTEESR
jgi:ABC-2 type transport system ATP-binding protein